MSVWLGIGIFAAGCVFGPAVIWMFLWSLDRYWEYQRSQGKKPIPGPPTYEGD